MRVAGEELHSLWQRISEMYLFGGICKNPQYANLFALVENTCRYLAPAYYGDVLILWTATHAVGKSSFQLVYHVWREKDEMLTALGHSVQVWLSETRQATRLPSAVCTALTTALYPELSKPSAYKG